MLCKILVFDSYCLMTVTCIVASFCCTLVCGWTLAHCKRWFSVKCCVSRQLAEFHIWEITTTENEWNGLSKQTVRCAEIHWCVTSEQELPLNYVDSTLF